MILIQPNDSIRFDEANCVLVKKAYQSLCIIIVQKGGHCSSALRQSANPMFLP